MKKAYLITIRTVLVSDIVVVAESEDEAVDAARYIQYDENAFEPVDNEVELHGLASADDCNVFPMFDSEGGEYEGKVCDKCGKPMSQGYTDGDESVCEDCFDEWMNQRFGKHCWMQVNDDGCGGYFVTSHTDSDKGQVGTGIYWTEWED